jgi:hypothetical protein
MGLVGAWLVGDYFGLGADRAEGDARGGLVLLAPVAAAALGLVLSARRVRRRGWVLGLAALFGTLAVGAIVGSYGTWLRVPSYTAGEAIRMGVPTGISTALVFLPFVWTIAAFARRVGRARAGSLVDECDGRRVWSFVAFGVAVACPIVLASSERSSLFSLRSTSSLGLVATLVLFVGLVMDALSARRIGRAAMEVVGMREVDIARVDVEDVVDLGLGDEAHEEVQRGGTAYRTNERAVRAILGDPQLASNALRRSLALSALLFAVGLFASALVGFGTS